MLTGRGASALVFAHVGHLVLFSTQSAPAYLQCPNPPHQLLSAPWKHNILDAVSVQPFIKVYLKAFSPEMKQCVIHAFIRTVRNQI